MFINTLYREYRVITELLLRPRELVIQGYDN